MIEWIQNFIRNYSNGMYFPHIQIKDIIEILIVTIIVYEIMLWIKNTKAWMLLRGILMLGGFILLAWLFQINTILLYRQSSINSMFFFILLFFCHSDEKPGQVYSGSVKLSEDMRKTQDKMTKFCLRFSGFVSDIRKHFVQILY